MSGYAPDSPAKSTATSDNAYRPIQTAVGLLEMLHEFVPRTEFQTYKDAVSSSKPNPWFMIAFLTVVGILFTIAIFLIPRTLNDNDRKAIDSFELRIKAIEKAIGTLNEGFEEFRKRLP